MLEMSMMYEKQWCFLNRSETLFFKERIEATLGKLVGYIKQGRPKQG